MVELLSISLVGLIVLLLLVVIASIPLNLAVKMLGGESSIMKVILVNIIVAVAAFFIDQYVGIFAGLASFIAMLFIYKIMFKIGWLKAFFAWILQFVIVGVFVFVLLLLGISILAL